MVLNDSQVTILIIDEYKIKTGSESPSGRLCPERVLTSRFRGDDFRSMGLASLLSLSLPLSIVSLPRRRESRTIKPENNL